MRVIEKRIRVLSLADARTADVDATRGDPASRLEAMEDLRRMYFGYDDDPPRLLEEALAHRE